MIGCLFEFGEVYLYCEYDLDIFGDGFDDNIFFMILFGDGLDLFVNNFSKVVG